MALQQRKPIAASRRVVIVASDAGRVAALRGPLIRQVTARGHKVLCVTARSDAAAVKALVHMGAEHASFVLPSGPLKLLSDRPARRALAATLSGWHASVVLGIGGKAVAMAALAARRIPGVRIVLITSSPDVLSADRERAGIGRRWIAGRVLGAADVIVAHNADDAARLTEIGGDTLRAKVQLLPGAGVDVSHFQPLALPPVAGGLVFGMMAQALPGKGAREFCEAARIVRKTAPSTRFVLALEGAGTEAGPSGFEDAVEIAQAPADVRPLIGRCHVIVLPSHREGFAHEVAVALACGRPAITTTVAGCRETADERVSGVLVPPGDVAALASAMTSFIRRPEQLAWMAQAARLKAERRFDAAVINSRLMDLLELAKGDDAP